MGSEIFPFEKLDFLNIHESNLISSKLKGPGYIIKWEVNTEKANGLNQTIGLERVAKSPPEHGCQGSLSRYSLTAALRSEIRSDFLNLRWQKELLSLLHVVTSGKENNTGMKHFTGTDRKD